MAPQGRFREVARSIQLMLILEQGENFSKSYFIRGRRRKNFPNSNPADKAAPKPFNSRNFPLFPAISRFQFRLSNVTAKKFFAPPRRHQFFEFFTPQKKANPVRGSAAIVIPQLLAFFKNARTERRGNSWRAVRRPLLQAEPTAHLRRFGRIKIRPYRRLRT